MYVALNIYVVMFYQYLFTMFFRHIEYFKFCSGKVPLSRHTGHILNSLFQKYNTNAFGPYIFGKVCISYSNSQSTILWRVYVRESRDLARRLLQNYP